MRFTIRDILWLTVVSALGIGMLLNHIDGKWRKLALLQEKQLRALAAICENGGVQAGDHVVLTDVSIVVNPASGTNRHAVGVPLEYGDYFRRRDTGHE